ncbi:hypothetical protein SAHL_04930 [Salinisphaera orenii YIM 95161]|uniref:Glycosyltransferase 2-like domain-containing protein n=1 Tax=Salinisphaera orenii YIM 95161 TaxID=1051139 RepID=A0A423Q1V0_9GAMM|nr:hypothetical protein SAHL_04930 [Salinisphaera halophila YIM 95161]
MIVVNDGSTSPEVAMELDRYRSERVTVVHQTNTGAPGALNHAISLARGPYIAVHDAGDASRPDRLQEQSRALDAEPSLVGVGCFTEDLMVQDNGGTTREKLNDDKPERLNHRDFLAPRNFLSGGEVMFRKEIHQKVGGYRSAFRYAQDRDLWLRMSMLGDFGIVQTMLYERRIYAQGVKASLRKSIMQKQLSHFARECAQMRMQKGYDLVDIFSDQAPMYRARTKTAADNLARYALWYLYHDDHESANILADLAIRERVTLRSVGINAIAKTTTVSNGRHEAIKSLLRRKISKFDMQKPETLIRR